MVWNETVNLSDLSLISSDIDVLSSYIQLCDLVQHVNALEKSLLYSAI